MCIIDLVVANTIRAVVVLMLVASAIIAGVVVMRATVSTGIRAIMIRPGEIVMVVVGIGDVDAEMPTITTGVDGSIEVVGLYEAAVLAAAQHPAQVVIAHIQEVIVTVERPFFATQHIVHQIAYTGDEVIVDFIHIVVLLGVQVQFISHFIGKEAGLLTYFAITHSVRACAANGSTQCGKQDKHYSFHGGVFFT